MTHSEYQKAAAYWQEKDKANITVPADKLRDTAERFLEAHKVCSLATACVDFVRNTPIEYSYFDGAFYMFSEGGLKFRALEQNKNVCLAIYDDRPDFGNLCGMQITGTAELVEEFSPEYNKVAEHKHIPLEALKKLPSPMHLIKVLPQEIEFLKSAFKKEGFSSRQKLTLPADVRCWRIFP